VDEAAGFDRYRSVLPEAAVAIKSGVCAIHNVSEGGILAALWELAEGAGVGLTIDLKKLPIRQETVEICNHCNVNPYELLSGGCLLMTTSDGLGLVTALQQKEIPAVVVGKTTDSKDRLILNEDEVRYLDRPHEDSIYEKDFEEKAATAAE
jgi:hydrogenase maturation factor